MRRLNLADDFQRRALSSEFCPELALISFLALNIFGDLERTRSTITRRIAGNIDQFSKILRIIKKTVEFEPFFPLQCSMGKRQLV